MNNQRENDATILGTLYQLKEEFEEAMKSGNGHNIEKAESKYKEYKMLVMGLKC